MYAFHFGLSETPFSISPDPRFLYMSKRHREAMAHLLYGIKEGGGFVQLTGEVGTGKTTLCRCLLLQLPENVDVALILNPQISESELLATLCDELHIEYPDNATPKTTLNVINEYLLTTYAEGRRAVLIIDEAQLLTCAVLEQVRILTNLETTRQKLLQIILIGQPELSITLSRSDLTQLAQRITARYHLQALNVQETREYVKHRLAVVGCQKPLFGGAALRSVYKYSEGVPRLINVICDRALLGAYSNNAQRVSASVVRNAAKEVLGAPSPRKTRWSWEPAVALLLIVGTLLWLPQTRQGIVDLVDRTDILNPDNTAGESAVSANENPNPPESPDAVESMAAAVETVDRDAAVVVSRPVPVDSVPEPAPLPPLTDGDYSDAARETTVPAVAEPEPFEAEAAEDETAALMTAVVEPAEPPKIEFADVLESQSNDYQVAFKSMAERWVPEFPAGSLPANCDQTREIGLKCMNKNGTWTNLRNYNRAAILLLRFRGRTRPVLLTGLDADNVTVQIGASEYTYPVSEVEKYWYGKYVLLWRPPSLEYDVINAVSTGPDVQWLRQVLNRVAGEDGAGAVDVGNSAYDEELRKRIVSFQKNHDLDADGVVGADTLLHLNTLLNEPNIPLLTRSPTN